MAQYTPYRKGTLLVPSGPSNHLHIICTDPIYSAVKGCDVVLVVNISSVPSVGYFDRTCILDVGDHGFIKHPSYLVYSKSVLWRCPTISNKVDIGEYIPRSDIDNHILLKVIQGFNLSDHTPFSILQFLKRNSI